MGRPEERPSWSLPYLDSLYVSIPKGNAVKGQRKVDYEKLSDRSLAELFAMKDPQAVRLIACRNNQRLFRAAWCILRDRNEAQDVVQNTYLRAFSAIASFEGRSSLTTWLTRIAINEAIERKRTASRQKELLDI